MNWDIAFLLFINHKLFKSILNISYSVSTKGNKSIQHNWINASIVYCCIISVRFFTFHELQYMYVSTITGIFISGDVKPCSINQSISRMSQKRVTIHSTQKLCCRLGFNPPPFTSMYCGLSTSILQLCLEISQSSLSIPLRKLKTLPSPALSDLSHTQCYSQSQL